MNARDFLAKFEGAKRVGDGHLVRCRAHDDRHGSLSISVKPDGTILVNCHAGCTAEQIVRSVGCELRDLFPEGGPNGHRQGGGGLIPLPIPAQPCNRRPATRCAGTRKTRNCR